MRAPRGRRRRLAPRLGADGRRLPHNLGRSGRRKRKPLRNRLDVRLWSTSGSQTGRRARRARDDAGLGTPVPLAPTLSSVPHSSRFVGGRAGAQIPESGEGDGGHEGRGVELNKWGARVPTAAGAGGGPAAWGWGRAGEHQGPGVIMDVFGECNV